MLRLAPDINMSVHHISMMPKNKPLPKPFIGSDISDFQRRIYEKLLEVPRGSVTTYRDLAHAIGSKAYRAVGSALKKNPFAPRVPCHRVVNSDGSLGGFARGPKKKRAILQQEGIRFTENKIDDFDSVTFIFNRKKMGRPGKGQLSGPYPPQRPEVIDSSGFPGKVLYYTIGPLYK